MISKVGLLPNEYRENPQIKIEGLDS